MQEQLSKKQRKRLARMEKKQAMMSANTRKKNTKSFLTWTIVVIVILAIVWGLTLVVRNSDSGNVGPVSVNLNIEDSDWATGPEQGSLELIEYSDFQCPACAAYAPILDQLKSEFAEDLRFAYRHFPLRQVHPHAQLAAQAAEAAGKQGQFWQMHDRLFETQAQWSNLPRVGGTFADLAEELGLDREQFENDLESDEVKDSVDADANSAAVIGLRATPSFVLNGNLIQAPPNLGQFRNLLEEALLASDGE